MSEPSWPLNPAPMLENFIADLPPRPGAFVSGSGLGSKMAARRPSSDAASRVWWSSTAKSLFLSMKLSDWYVTSPA